MIPFQQKQDLLKQNTEESKYKIKHKEANSDRLFGTFTKHGFKFDGQKVPFFNIPSLEHFKLRPYVSVHTPPVSQEIKEKIRALNDFTLEENFGRYKEE